MLFCTVAAVVLVVHVRAVPDLDALAAPPDKDSGAPRKLTAFEAIMKVNGRSAARRQGKASRGGVELTQGDIVVTDKVRMLLKHGRVKRGALKDKDDLWITNGKPEIPYEIQSNAAEINDNIIAAIKHWEQNVPCLKFVQRTTQSDYISFFRGMGCSSYVGRSGRKQSISLAQGCESLSTVVHEIGHALGFWHEQSRPDRDSFVNIIWSNIPQEVRSNFLKLSSNDIDSLGVAYDYKSVMHYSSRAFGNGKLTITRKDGSEDLGNSEGLSALDIQQAKLLYCANVEPVTTPAPTTQPPSGCQYSDKSPFCGVWAGNGYCSSSSIYSTYMSQNCQKSCNCKNGCQYSDNNQYCVVWAQRDYCSPSSQYYPFMSQNCQKSCKCDKGCQYSDNNQYCVVWAQRDFCSPSSQYYPFMSRNCQKSCKCDKAFKGILVPPGLL